MKKGSAWRKMWVPLLLLVGCVSYDLPFFGSQDSLLQNQDFEVLGLVSTRAESVGGGKRLVAREMLLEKAKELYPTADDVVNVIFYREVRGVSLKEASTIGIRVEGRAIRYRS